MQTTQSKKSKGGISCLAVNLLILFLSLSSYAAPNELRLPSLPATTLKEQFPKVPSVALTSLRLYRQDLEFFRKNVLEGYNQALIIHAGEVDEASKQLEKERAAGRINADDYNRMHQYLKVELARLGKNGDYLKAYLNYFSLYKDRMNWADSSIAEITASKQRKRYQM